MTDNEYMKQIALILHSNTKNLLNRILEGYDTVLDKLADKSIKLFDDHS